MTITATETLDQVRALVDPPIRALLDRLDPRTRLVAGYHLGYWDSQGVPTNSGGKKLRAALALLSARAAGAPAKRGVPAAAAVELAHNFSLLHDDVMDNDATRRHRPTAWAVYGVGPAILAGDALLSLGNQVLAESDEPGAAAAARSLGTEVRRLISGQAADLAFETRTDVGLDECLSMAEEKTAALLSCSCALGAQLCAAPAQLVQALSTFGTHLGMAFQLVDDLLGIWGAPEVTGKPVLADLAARKKSIPVVRAATSSHPAAGAFRDLYFTDGELSVDDLAKAATLIEETGAREWTVARADAELSAALSTLSAVDVASDVRDELTAIALFITSRDH